MIDNLFNNSHQVSMDPDEEDEMNELQKQEMEIKKWKGIYDQMSRRLQDSKQLFESNN